MKKLLATLLCLIFSFSMIYAQSEENISEFNLSTQWTTPQAPASGKRIKDSYILKTSGDELFYIFNAGIPPEKPNWGDYLAKQNLATGDFLNKEIKFEKIEGIKPDFVTSEVVNDQIYVFSSINNKKEKKYKFYAHKIDESTLEFNDEPILIYEASSEELKGKLDIDILLKASPDKKSLAIIYTISNKKNQIVSFQLGIYDSNLSKINIFDLFGVEQFGLAENTAVNSLAIDNDANAYVSFMEEGANSSRKLFINQYPNVANNPLILTKDVVLTAGYYPTGATLDIDNENELICVGFYKNKESNENIGVFSFTANRDYTKTNLVETPFDIKYLPSGASDKDKQNMKAMIESTTPKGDMPVADLMRGYRFSKIFFLKNGDYAVVAEKSLASILTIRNYSSKMTNSYWTYTFSNIMVSVFNANGTVKNLYNIPEEIFSNLSTHFKASFVVDADNNDNIHLLTSAMTTDVAGAIKDKSQPYYYKLDNSGSLSKYTIFTDNKDLRKQFAPLLSIGIGNGDMILTSLDYGKFIGQTKMAFTKVHLE